MGRVLQVTAAVLRREDGRILLARRRPGKSLAGKWEFPGGKIEPGETPEACLSRELREELGIEVAVGERLLVSRAAHPLGAIELQTYAVRYCSGELKLSEHDAIAWAAPAELAGYDVPEADRPIVDYLIAEQREGGALQER